jgi:UDP-N-acetyl-D-mannosaminuronic acid dehydrogenase
MKTSAGISKILVQEDETISLLLETLSRKSFENRQSGFVIIVDKNQSATGVVTDSDIRKFAAKNLRMPDSISEIVNRDFIWIFDDVEKNELARVIAKKLSARGWSTNYPVRYIPVLTRNKVPQAIVDILDFEQEVKKYRDLYVVIGLGYVGLTLSLALADAGKQVAGVDIDTEKISMLKTGSSTLFEEGLGERLKKHIGENIQFYTDLNVIDIQSGQSCIYFICLPTPLNELKNSLDLSFVDNFVKQLSKKIKQGDSVVMRSTVPVGTGRQICRAIEEELGWIVGSDFYYVEGPERTVEGNALRELRDLPQIIGGATEACQEKGIEIFRDISQVTLPLSSIESAELVKIAGNAYRDYVFAFSNYLAEIARDFNVDVDEVIEKSNWGYARSTIASPSPGVGGPCLTKDPYLFHTLSSQDSPIIRSRKYNETVPSQVIEHILKWTESRIAAVIVGIAFKGVPPTDDIRNSSNLIIAEGLKPHFSKLEVWDAVINSSISAEEVFQRFLDNSKDINLIAVLNNHKDNAKFVIDLVKLIEPANLTIFDPWRLLDPKFTLSQSNISAFEYLTLSKSQKIVETSK